MLPASRSNPDLVARRNLPSPNPSRRGGQRRVLALSFSSGRHRTTWSLGVCDAAPSPLLEEGKACRALGVRGARRSAGVG
jgi:hypothetical protein